MQGCSLEEMGIRVYKSSQRKTSSVERPVQFLYPLELHCSRRKEMQKLDAEAKEFRPKRKAAIDATANVQGTLDYEEENDI